MNITTEQFNKLLEKYALSRPITPEDQRYIISRSRAGLKRILKQKGSYGAIIGWVVAVSVLFKKMGIKLSIMQSKILIGVTATAISAGTAAGGYTTAHYIRAKIIERKKIEQKREQPAADAKLRSAVPRDLKTDRDIRNYYRKLEEINLDDGTRLVGAVISQHGGTVRIHTVHGVIEVPVKSIRNIRML